jgi:hypothetical protein
MRHRDTEFAAETQRKPVGRHRNPTTHFLKRSSALSERSVRKVGYRGFVATADHPFTPCLCASSESLWQALLCVSVADSSSSLAQQPRQQRRADVEQIDLRIAPVRNELLRREQQRRADRRGRGARPRLSCRSASLR